MAASTGVADVLLDLFILLLAAKLGDEICKRIGQPSIVGEILAGVVVGPSVLDLVHPDTPIEVFAELGVVFLLFWVGLETKLSDLAQVGRSAVLVGVLGVVVPLAGGIGLGVARGDDTGTAIFLGAALVATSAGITSAVLIQLGALRTRVARTIVGAAIVDDILALVILAIAIGLAVDGQVDVGSIAVTLALTIGFLAFFALGGTRVTQRWPRIFEAPRFSESPLLPVVILCLGLAALAAEIGLAAIIGALIAGLIVAETKDQSSIEDEVAPLYAFFPPFFFAFIGTQVDLETLAEPATLGLLAIVTALAIVTKFAGAYLGARALGPREAAAVGVGMVPRGEVGIIVAGIGKSEGVISTELFAVIVGMSLLTTLIAPPLLRMLMVDERREPHPEAV